MFDICISMRLYFIYAQLCSCLLCMSLFSGHDCSGAGLQEQSSFAARAKKDASAAQKRAAPAEAETTAPRGQSRQQSLAIGSGSQQAEVAPLHQPPQAAQVPGMLTACTNKAHSWACRALCLCTVSVVLCLCVYVCVPVVSMVCIMTGLPYASNVMSCHACIPGGWTCDECRQQHLLAPTSHPSPRPSA